MKFAMGGVRHIRSCGNSKYRSTTLQERYRIPEQLIKDLFLD